MNNQNSDQNKCKQVIGKERVKPGTVMLQTRNKTTRLLSYARCGQNKLFI